MVHDGIGEGQEQSTEAHASIARRAWRDGRQYSSLEVVAPVKDSLLDQELQVTATVPVTLQVNKRIPEEIPLINPIGAIESADDTTPMATKATGAVRPMGSQAILRALAATQDP